MLGDRLGDAGGEMGQRGGVGCCEGGAGFVAGLLGLEEEEEVGMMFFLGGGEGDGHTLRRRVRAALASFRRPL